MDSFESKIFGVSRPQSPGFANWRTRLELSGRNESLLGFFQGSIPGHPLIPSTDGSKATTRANSQQRVPRTGLDYSAFLERFRGRSVGVYDMARIQGCGNTLSHLAGNAPNTVS